VDFIGATHLPENASVTPAINTALKTIDKVDHALLHNEITLRNLSSIISSTNHITKYTHPGLTNNLRNDLTQALHDASQLPHITLPSDLYSYKVPLPMNMEILKEELLWSLNKCTHLDPSDFDHEQAHILITDAGDLTCSGHVLSPTRELCKAWVHELPNDLAIYDDTDRKIQTKCSTH